MRTLLAILMFCTLAESATAEPANVGPARKNAQGILVHEVRSPYQPGSTQIRVHLPQSDNPETRYPVVYVLPVEAGNESRYGDGLAEAQQQHLPNKHQAIFVAPTFAQLPWYADHPTDPMVRQESHFLNVVVPFVDQTYPTKADRSGRFLLGFSKSGWGAWTLLLRHPDTFNRAAAWDAPLAMREVGRYGSAQIFATQDNFEQYCVPNLLKARAGDLSDATRLVLLGWGGFREETHSTHALLDSLKIPHLYRDGPERKHDWHSGWVTDAVQLLLCADPH